MPPGPLRDGREGDRTRRSPSMVCATDMLLGLVMTPSDDCALSVIRLPSEVRRSRARPREQADA